MVNPVAVKICGITTPDAIGAAVAAGAIYDGLVFHPKSPRNLDIDRARELARLMRGKLKVVTLLADPSDEQLAAVAAQVAPDFFQLHGNEAARRVAYVRAKFNTPVIKAVAVAEASDLALAAEYENVADLLMFDAKAPRGAERPGGHGQAFDWKILAGRSFNKPWFLAGGLDPDNVARAIELSGAKMVVVSSGVESTPGIKDPARIQSFLDAIRHPASLSKQNA
jgi:phosphoribosylanthranilate isomerase